MKSLTQLQSRQGFHSSPSVLAKNGRVDNAIELRHLRYFVSVADHLHFGRAASALHIAQPSLTRQIHDLEERLDVKLFDRGARRVSLTCPGALLLTESRRILEEVSVSLRRVQSSR